MRSYANSNSPAPCTCYQLRNGQSPDTAHSASNSSMLRRKMSYWQQPLSNYSQPECKSSVNYTVIHNLSNCSNSLTHKECSPFCSGFPQTLPSVFLAFSCLSAFSCVWVFVTYLVFPRLSGYSSKVFLYRSGLTVRLAYIRIQII